MKKVNIIISITLIALTAAAWAQEPSGKDRLYAENHRDVRVMTADYRSENRVEAFANRLQHWLRQAESRGYYESPEVSMSFFFEDAEVVYDLGSSVETWMEAPFSGCLAEEVVNLENWMAYPFETELSEEPLTIENWMSNPFEGLLTEEPVALESWMSDPFGELLGEEPLELELWMIHPFEIENRCEDGQWMATSPK